MEWSGKWRRERRRKRGSEKRMEKSKRWRKSTKLVVEPSLGG